MFCYHLGMSRVICSHGFGVAADARGMFTEIAEAFPEHDFVMFDYNTFDSAGNTIVASLDDQAKILQRNLDSTETGSVLLCHSQGSIIAGLVDLSNVSKVILLAPPVLMSMERIIDKMMRKPGGEVNLDGLSKLPRSDGTLALLPIDYLESLKDRDPISIYGNIASQKPTVIVRAIEDEVLGFTNVDEVESAEIADIHADHNFTGESRQELISILKSLIAS